MRAKPVTRTLECLAVAGLLSMTAASTAPGKTSAAATACAAEPVHYAPYPGHGQGLSGIPWIRGYPASSGLIGLLVYWPSQWRQDRVAHAMIPAGGKTPDGLTTKMMWVFLGPKAITRAGDQLTVKGTRLDGPGSFKASFAPISYRGQNRAPSFASTIVVPRPGCWKITLTSGALKSSTTFLAVSNG